LREIQLEFHLADAGEVAVALDEAGDRELPVEIDHSCVRARAALDLIARAHRRDAVAADRNRLRFRGRRVDGNDAAVDEDEVGWRARLLRRTRRGRDRGDGESKQSDANESLHCYSFSCLRLFRIMPSTSST